MKVLITGGGGFLGQNIARALLARGGMGHEPGAPRELNELVLFDQAFPPDRFEDTRVKYVSGDILDRALLSRACAPSVESIFHLASVVSAGAEADFDLGMRVNVDGMRAMLEVGRAQPAAPRLVFTSSVAAFGGNLPNVVLDTT